MANQRTSCGTGSRTDRGAADPAGRQSPDDRARACTIGSASSGGLFA
jgi:hypothetical protein